MREALQCVMAEPNAEAGWSPQTPEILLGVLSSDVRLGLRALRDWTDTVNADYVIPEVRVCSLACFVMLQLTFTGCNGLLHSENNSSTRGFSHHVLLSWPPL